MLTDNFNLMFRAYCYRFIPEQQEIRLLLKKLNPGDVGVNVGSHKGVNAYLSSRVAGRGGKTAAFQPRSDSGRPCLVHNFLFPAA